MIFIWSFCFFTSFQIGVETEPVPQLLLLFDKVLILSQRSRKLHSMLASTVSTHKWRSYFTPKILLIFTILPGLPIKLLRTSNGKNIFVQRNVPKIFVSICFLKSEVGKNSTGPK